MKTIILNASPRKNWNTAQLLKSVQNGAESVGAETEYIDLYDLNFTGCHSCLACKRKDAQRCHCFWKDDFSPILDRIYSAGALIIGSPIYFGDTTSQFHAVLERLRFVALSYDDYHNYFDGKVNVGAILTMNATPEMYKEYYEAKLSEQLNMFRMLNGELRILPVCDTLQVKDYSKYDMASFSEEHKKSVHDKQFSVDLSLAFTMGAELSQPKPNITKEVQFT